jgi:hypothetical protein
MSLPAGQQRVLDGIAETMRVTEPRLTAMFAIFTRLTKNEPRPGREAVAPPRRRGWLPRCVRRMPPPPGKRGSLGWRRIAIISQLAIGFVAFGVLIGVGARAAPGCALVQQPRVATAAASHLQTCPPPGGTGALLAGK